MIRRSLALLSALSLMACGQPAPAPVVRAPGLAVAAADDAWWRETCRLAEGMGERGSVRALVGAYLEVTSRIAVRKMIFPGRVRPRKTPLAYGMPEFETVALRAPDGLRLAAWWVPALTPSETTVLLVHGHGSCREGWFQDGQAGMLHPRYNVLALDLRNNGESEGDATTFGHAEAQDVRAAVAWLRARGQRVAVMGVSMGAATSIRAAALEPAIEAVVADCPFATLQSAVAGFVSITGAASPVLIAAATIARANRTLGIDMREAEPIMHVGRIAPRPLMFIHGEADPVITADNSRILYQASGMSQDLGLWIAPDAGHGASAMRHPEAYRERLLGFLDRAFAR